MSHKHQIARRKAEALGICWYEMEREELYAALQTRGYVWAAGDREWHYQPDHPSLTGSIFVEPDGRPANLIKLRLSAHNAILEDTLDRLSGLLSVTRHKLTWISDPYPNPKTPSSKVYLDALMDIDGWRWHVLTIEQGKERWRSFKRVAHYLSVLDLLTTGASYSFFTLPRDDTTVTILTQDHAPWQIDEAFIARIEEKFNRYTKKGQGS